MNALANLLLNAIGNSIDSPNANATYAIINKNYTFPDPTNTVQTNDTEFGQNWSLRFWNLILLDIFDLQITAKTQMTFRTEEEDVQIFSLVIKSLQSS